MLVSYIEAAAVIVSAISGMIKASEKQLDIVGAYFIALIVTFGGGTLRDVLLDRRPFFWVENSEYLIIVLLITIAFVYVPLFHRIAKRLHTRTNMIEAIGLGLFSMAGLVAALNLKMPIFPATLMGVITGVAGGVIRDVITNDVPVIFQHTGGLYATASFAGCWTFILIMYLFNTPFLAFIIGESFIVCIRLISIYLGIRLPMPLWIKKEDN
jgi:uncharacterized membrane protein YeiH